MKHFGIQPFVDGSCRREPDLESSYPSVTALCHGKLFAPKLKEGDQIIYMTVSGRFAPQKDRHWRLVARLAVRNRFATHAEASEWYAAKGSPIPSNCLVPGNEPLPLEYTLGSKLSLRAWERGYQARANAFPTFLVCDPVTISLGTPPVLTRDDLTGIFGRIPGTRNPKRISANEAVALFEVARLARG